MTLASTVWKTVPSSEMSAFPKPLCLSPVNQITGLITGYMCPVANKNESPGTSLVVQWLRICLPMQGTQVRSLVGELRSHMPRGNEARAPQLLSPCATTREPACHRLQSPCTTTREKPTRRNERSQMLQGRCRN